jgi:hypothetical protein
VSTTEATNELTFDPPGPGFYEQDSVHLPRAATRYWAETHPAPFAQGTSEFTAFYGMLIGGLSMTYINGIGYKSVAPLPDEEVPARFARAEEVFANKLWREQLREWDESVKPAAIAKHRELQAVDADALSVAELVAYLEQCRDHHVKMIAQHMRYTAGAVVPTGDFLAHVGDWTGLPTAELLGLMRGASPVSAGASDELDLLLAAIEADPRARELLASDGDGAETLAALRSLDGEAGAAMTAYLDLVGNRLLDGFDIAEPSVLELPDQLLRAIRTAATTGVVESDLEARIAEVRAKVPPEHQESFDELLGEARTMYRLRDERGVYSDIWASGIMRRAALAAGRRLAASGRAHAGGVPSDSLGEGRSADARHAAAAPRRPLDAAARSRPADAGDRDRARGVVRQLAGGARGGHAARPRGEPRRLRRTRTARRRPGRLQPNRAG